MGVKANWFLDDVRPDVGDPFAGVGALPTPMPPVVERLEDVGVPFDLRDPGSLLTAATALLNEEGRLWDQGVTCAVRDRADTSCSACAFAHHEENGHDLQRLCEIGREQERLLTTHAHLMERARG